MRHHSTELFYADDSGRKRIEHLDATAPALPQEPVASATIGAPA